MRQFSYGKCKERQHVISRGLHDRRGGGERLAQHLDDPLPVGAPLIRRLDHEYRIHDGGHHVLACLGHVAEQVAQEVNPAALTAAALEHPLDRRRQPQVGVRDHQQGALQAPLLEAAQELAPEALGLTFTHGDSEHLAVAEGIDGDCNLHGSGADLHVAAQMAREIGGVQVDVRKAGMVQRTAQEGLDLLIQPLADAAYLRFGDAAGTAQSVDLPGGDAAAVAVRGALVRAGKGSWFVFGLMIVLRTGSQTGPPIAKTEI